MIAQIGITIFGVTAICLANSAAPARRRWAPIFGLAGQPFWIWSAFSAQQWGVLALCVLYTAAWANGFNQHWMRKS